jgi:YegS/Rv2252/BmrU family lipid kinase
MKIAQSGHERDRTGLSMRGVVLSRCAQTEKYRTEKMRQSFHLINPPEFESLGRRSRARRGDTPIPKLPQLIPNPDPLPSIHEQRKTAQVQSTFGQAMRKAALLYNPDSGGRKRRQPELESVLALLRDAGVEANLILTHSSGHAEEKARQAVLAGCDTIFACGGDGTIHNIIQVLVNTQVALAILPMGTANVLAHDLGLPMNIVAAATAALLAAPRRVALGRVQYLDMEGKSEARYFVIAAGVGVDAHLFYKLHEDVKQRLGMAAYYAKAWNLWLTHSMVRFQVEYSETGSDHPKRAELTELLGVRIRNFGGVLQELAPGASLDRDDVRLVLCRTASRLAYLFYVTRGLLRRKWNIPGIDLAHAGKVTCQYPSDHPSFPKSNSRYLQPKVYVEADGELLGTLPAEITTVPDALTLLSFSL